MMEAVAKTETSDPILTTAPAGTTLPLDAAINGLAQANKGEFGPVTPPTARKAQSPLQSQGSQRTNIALPSLVEFDPNASKNRKDSRRRQRVPKSRSLASSMTAQSMDDLRTSYSYPVEPVTFRPSGFNNSALRRVQIVGMSLPNINATQNASLTSQNLPPPSTPHTQPHPTQSSGNKPGSSYNTPTYIPDLMITAHRFPHDHTGLPPLTDPHRLSQRQRMYSEVENQQRVKLIRFKNGTWPHREPQELELGGSKVELCERDDVLKELNQLKCVTHILPAKAKELYVGRFKMPQSHMTNKPRNPRRIVDDPVFLKYLQDSQEKKKTEDALSVTSIDQTAAENAPPPVVPSTPTAQSAAPNSATISTKTPLHNTIMISNIEQLIPADDHEKATAKYQQFTSNNEAHDSQKVVDSLEVELKDGERDYLMKLCATALVTGTISASHYITLWAVADALRKHSDDDAVKKSYTALNTTRLDELLAQLLDLFQAIDRQNTGELSKAALLEILTSNVNKDLTSERAFTDVQTTLFKEGSENINKLAYLVHLPYFVSLSA